ncbi:HipA N-terminal domain-containing protein [Rhodococcus qingshengii]|nr:HipA N-terminal domain-containing protein [Rhodococcus qingshengii]
MVLNERFHGVNLNGNRVGVLHHIGDVCRFVFVEEYWEDPSREVLGLWFEDKPNSSLKSSLRLPFWFSNLLPEGPLRKWIAAD